MTEVLTGSARIIFNKNSVVQRERMLSTFDRIIPYHVTIIDYFPKKKAHPGSWVQQLTLKRDDINSLCPQNQSVSNRTEFVDLKLKTVKYYLVISLC